jgi:hypothetical protein
VRNENEEAGVRGVRGEEENEETRERLGEGVKRSER